MTQLTPEVEHQFTLLRERCDALQHLAEKRGELVQSLQERRDDQLRDLARTRIVNMILAACLLVISLLRLF